MSKVKLILVILLIPIISKAQVSIVNALPDIEQKDGWKTKLSTSASWRDDNNKDTELIVDGGVAIDYKNKPWLLHFMSKGIYHCENGANTEGSIVEHLRLRISVGDLISPLTALISASRGEKVNRFNWYDAVYLETFAQHEYDKFRALNARILWGIGPTIKFISTDSVHMMVGSAYMLEHIDFVGYIDSELNHRWSNYIQINISPSDRFSIDGVVFAQFKFDDFSDHLLMSTLALKVKATEWFGVELGGGIEYDSKPPPNIKNVGTNIRSGSFVEF